ncbi:MAG: hypothetical protein P8J32_07645, partial [bacterium]|nr:hypothetical protein [bacterium]
IIITKVKAHTTQQDLDQGTITPRNHHGNHPHKQQHKTEHHKCSDPSPSHSILFHWRRLSLM